MKNGFEMHGLTHLSPSQLNTFSSAPDVWVAEKLLGKRTPAGPPMHRGIVVEDAVSDVLFGEKTVEEAKKSALFEFNKRCALMDVRDAERDGLDGMIDQALAALDGFPPPMRSDAHKQHKISLKCNLDDGTSIEIIGFLDFAFEGNMKKIVDLKTTHRMPPKEKMSRTHQIQRCIYQHAAPDGWEVDFLYVTPKKSALLSDGDPADVLAMVKAIANRMNRFLKVSSDKQELASIVPVMPDSFYWSSPESIKIRREVYGF